jgi:hypothetical protein
MLPGAETLPHKTIYNITFLGRHAMNHEMD